MIGLYTPKDSLIHQARPGLKMAGLCVVSLGLIRVPSATWLATAGLGVVCLWFLARLPVSALAADVRPLIWIGLAIFLFHALLGQVGQGGMVVGRLLVLVTVAMLITRTTPVMQMLHTLERVLAPLNLVGIRPDRIAFLMVLTIRMVPVVVSIVSQVREATRARGAGRSIKALVLPAASRTVLFAGQVGDALDARGPGQPRS